MTEQEILAQPTPRGVPIKSVSRTSQLPEGSQAQCDAFEQHGWFDRAIHCHQTFELIGVQRTIRV